MPPGTHCIYTEVSVPTRLYKGMSRSARQWATRENASIMGSSKPFSSSRRRMLRNTVALSASSPFTAMAQSAGAVRRIGYLSLETPGSESSTNQQRLLRGALAKLRLEDGVNLAIEWRFASGATARLPELAKELVRSRVELIIAAFNQSIVAASAATTTIPIIMFGALVPVELGLADSLARPGRNLTGTTYFAPETTGKLLELLKEARPGIQKVAVLTNPEVPGKPFYQPMYHRAADALGLSLLFFEVARPGEITSALQRIAASRSDALYIVGDSVINPSMPAIASFAVEHGLVSIGTALVHVRQGSLLYYGPDFPNMVDRVALYVARVLGGARPGELPIEEPTRYELVINLKTARALGITISPVLRARANRFLEASQQRP